MQKPVHSPESHRHKAEVTALHTVVAEGGGGIVPGRIPMHDREHKAIDELLAEHGKQATLTRRDPDNSGPLLAQIGERTFVVAEDGTVTDG